MTIAAKGARHVVIEATRKSKWGNRFDVGYFKTTADMIAAGFEEAQEVGIDDVMKSIRTTDVDCCLKMMNSHWQR